VREKTSR